MGWLEWSIGLRYALVGRGDRFVSFSSLASAIGIALGVAAVIVVMSVMNGFHINLRERILGAAAHVEVLLNGTGSSADWRNVLAEVAADERVAAAAPLIDRQALLSKGSRSTGVLIRGIEPEMQEGISAFETEPDLTALEPGQYKILLGSKLAASMGVGPGDELLLLAPRATHTLGGVLPRFKRVTMAGEFSFGVHDFDVSQAFMHFEDVATLYKAEGMDTIRVGLHDVYDAPAVASDIGDRLALTVFDWTTSNRTLFSALAVERRVMFVILSLIIAVAAFQIVAALVTMVRSKRGAIAILRTIGMRPSAIMRIFLFQGMLVGVTGTVAGVALGIALAFNINPIVTAAENIFGFDFFPGEVYYLETIPSVILAWDVFRIAALAFLLALLATVFPSLAAARVDPAEVLRDE